MKLRPWLLFQPHTLNMGTLKEFAIIGKQGLSFPIKESTIVCDIVKLERYKQTGTFPFYGTVCTVRKVTTNDRGGGVSLFGCYLVVDFFFFS